MGDRDIGFIPTILIGERKFSLGSLSDLFVYLVRSLVVSDFLTRIWSMAKIASPSRTSPCFITKVVFQLCFVLS